MDAGKLRQITDGETGILIEKPENDEDIAESELVTILPELEKTEDNE